MKKLVLETHACFYRANGSKFTTSTVQVGPEIHEVEIPEDVEEEEQLNWIFDKYRDTHFCCEEKEIERVSTAIRFFDECERKGFNAADYQDTVFHACSELDEGDRETLKWWEFMLENVYQEDEQTSEYPDFW